MSGDNRLPVLAEEIKAEHSAALAASATATRHAIQAGRLLAEAKEKVKHGGWLPWLKDNCCLSERTAQRYMRLAAKVPDLDPEDATRVSDLPIREALRVIADERVEIALPDKDADWETVWAWAEKQRTAPFNWLDWDLLGFGGIRRKLCDQTDVPVEVAFLLGMENDEFPVLRIASTQDIHDAIAVLATVAKAKAKRTWETLDFDFSGLGRRDTVVLLQTVNIAAEHTCGRLLRELKYRDEHWDLTTPEGSQGAADERAATIDALTARCDRKLEELEAAQAEAAA